MRRLLPVFVPSLVLLVACSAPKPAAQGNPLRRLVKTATDADAAKIDATPKKISIEDLVATKDPTGGKPGVRVDGFETSTFEVDAKIKSVQLKKDGDYYMVLEGKAGGRTVVEVPDPKLCKGSPLQGKIAATREAVEKRYHPTSEVKEVNDEATVTGVGFLGWGTPAKKGATGYRGPRLMPGTGIEFHG